MGAVRVAPAVSERRRRDARGSDAVCVLREGEEEGGRGGGLMHERAMPCACSHPFFARAERLWRAGQGRRACTWCTTRSRTRAWTTSTTSSSPCPTPPSPPRYCSARGGWRPCVCVCVLVCVRTCVHVLCVCPRLYLCLSVSVSVSVSLCLSVS